MSVYLENIPVQLIVHSKPALIGAAAWLQSCGMVDLPIDSPLSPAREH